MNSTVKKQMVVWERMWNSSNQEMSLGLRLLPARELFSSLMQYSSHSPCQNPGWDKQKNPYSSPAQLSSKGGWCKKKRSEGGGKRQGKGNRARTITKPYKTREVIAWRRNGRCYRLLYCLPPSHRAKEHEIKDFNHLVHSCFFSGS